MIFLHLLRAQSDECRFKLIPSIRVYIFTLDISAWSPAKIKLEKMVSFDEFRLGQGFYMYVCGGWHEPVQRIVYSSNQSPPCPRLSKSYTPVNF